MLRQIPVVGQKLISKAVGHAARQSENPKFTDYEVTKVGSKYFYAKPVDYNFKPTAYYIADWREKTDYNPTSQLYLNMEEYEEEKERYATVQELREYFSTYKARNEIPLSALRKIKEMLNEYTEV